MWHNWTFSSAKNILKLSNGQLQFHHYPGWCYRKPFSVGIFDSIGGKLRVDGPIAYGLQILKSGPALSFIECKHKVGTSISKNSTAQQLCCAVFADWCVLSCEAKRLHHLIFTNSFVKRPSILVIVGPHNQSHRLWEMSIRWDDADWQLVKHQQTVIDQWASVEI